MKILVIGNYYYPEHIGGVESVSFNLTRHYRKLGQDVRWVAADVPSNYREVGDGDVPIKSWNIAEEKLGFPSPIPYPEVFRKLYVNIKWCDVVHLQDSLYPINILAFLISKLLKKPVLITQYAKIIPYHQLYKRILQIIAYSTIGRIMFKTADKLVFITPNVREGMSQINPGKKYEVVPLGVDTDFYTPISHESRELLRMNISSNSTIPIILFVGRMVERKGVHLIRPLIERHKEWRWILVGRPDDYNPGCWLLENLTYYQNVSENELKNLYASADLLVHPSKGEGITLAVSESMACGTPVLVSNESLDNINNEGRELFYSVTPETLDIERKLCSVFQNINQLDELRIKVREYALSRLSWGRVSEQYLALLEILAS